MHEAPRTVVIGAGVAGLVAALRLAHRGHQVTVLERAEVPGGKIHTQSVGSALIESGPTVFTMRWVFDELLRSVGTRLDDQLRLAPLSVLARHFWYDGSQLDLFADAQRSETAVAEWAGRAEAARFREFCERARRVHDTLEGPVMRSPRPGMVELTARLGPSGLAVLSSIGPMRTLWQQMVRQFRDPRLQQLFARYATYCGSSPWQAPSTLMLVAQVEMDGVWSVEGGMGALAEMLAQLFADGRRIHEEQNHRVRAMPRTRRPVQQEGLVLPWRACVGAQVAQEPVDEILRRVVARRHLRRAPVLEPVDLVGQVQVALGGFPVVRSAVALHQRAVKAAPVRQVVPLLAHMPFAAGIGAVAAVL